MNGTTATARGRTRAGEADTSTVEQATQTSEQTPSPGLPGALVDAHVHIHPRFVLSDFFDHAAANFDAVARECGADDDTPGCLMLTECAWDHRFEGMREAVGRSVGNWRLSATEESVSIHVTAEGKRPLVVIAGRQLVTAERLEVLALGTDRRFEDGLPIDAAIARARAVGAMAVIPWGFGKWTGKRGRIVERMITSTDRGRFFIGDNGGRLHWGTPPLFEVAVKSGLRILPGSDPLPFSNQISRPGTTGFALPGAFDQRRPYESIRESLMTTAEQPLMFGKGVCVSAFLYSQIAMQLRKR